MRILYLNCQYGVAGDMFIGTLLTHIADKQAFLKIIDDLFPFYHVSYEMLARYEKTGIQMKMMIEKVEEKNKDISFVEMIGKKSQLPKENEKLLPHEILQTFPVAETIKKQVWQIFMTILQAQAAVHQKKMTNIHFTKLGSLDALLDITMTCLLLDKLKIERIIATPVNTGFGHTQYEDKIFAVPAPATKRILENVPHFHNALEGELCTPTGVALLKNVVNEFIPISEVKKKQVEASSYGVSFGLKVFPFSSYLESFIIDT